MRRKAACNVDDASDTICGQEIRVEDCVKAGQCDGKRSFLILARTRGSAHENFIGVVFVRTVAARFLPALMMIGAYFWASASLR